VSNSLKAKLWIVVRFLVFGVGGFLLMLAAWLSFLDHLNTHSKWLLVFAPMAIIGAVLCFMESASGGNGHTWACFSQFRFLCSSGLYHRTHRTNCRELLPRQSWQSSHICSRNFTAGADNLIRRNDSCG
jgi:hypothetical protein